MCYDIGSFTETCMSVYLFIYFLLRTNDKDKKTEFIINFSTQNVSLFL